MDIIEIRKKVKKNLDKERYEHTKGVMYTAGCLAMAYEYPIEKAMIAGLLHDCAKCLAVPKSGTSFCAKHRKVRIEQINVAARQTNASETRSCGQNGLVIRVLAFVCGICYST